MSCKWMPLQKLRTTPAEAYKSTMPIGMQESKRVQLHFIDGGGHMFSKKHDVIAMKLLKEFAAKHE